MCQPNKLEQERLDKLRELETRGLEHSPVRVSGLSMLHSGSTRRSSIVRLFLLIVLTLIAMVYVIKLMPNGVYVDIDSVNYIAAMRSLLAGHGFLHWDGSTFTHWTPLFPTYLAPIGWITSVLNMDFMKAITVSNALLFGITFFVAGLFFSEYLNNKVLAIIAVIALANFPMLFLLIYALSEPLFTLLILLFTITITRLERTQDKRWLIPLGVLAGLASLERYIGVFTVPTAVVAVLVFLRTEPIKRRFAYALVFGVLASLPTATLLLHNSLATGAISADFPPAQSSLIDGLMLGAQTIVGWFTALRFVSVPVSKVVSTVIVALCALLVLALLIALRRSRSASVIALQSVSLVLVGYIGVMSMMLLRYDFEAPDDRLLSPIYIYVIFIAAFALDLLLAWLQKHRRRVASWSARAVVIIAALWVVYFPLNRAVNELYVVYSGYCCMDPKWSASPVIEWLHTHPLNEPVLSNTPIPLYFSNTQATMAPASLSGWNNAAISTGYHYLVWMNYDHYAANTYTLQALSTFVKLTPVVEFSDGGVYLLGT